MDFIRNLPLFSIVLSLFSGVLCTLLKPRAARVYTLCLEGALTAAAVTVLGYTLRTGEAFTYVMGEFPAPWGNEIRAGALEALVTILFLVVLFTSVLAGGRYLAVDIDESKQNLYYTLINLMTAALLAMAYTNDLFTGYVFLEILTLTSCGILIVREIGRTTLAAVRYMILNLLGSGLFLLGVVLLYDVTGDLLMVPMHESIPPLVTTADGRIVLIMAVGILTVGLSIKSGLFPFHFWMPDTYGWATPSSAAIMSSLVSKCYIFLLMKVYWRVLGLEIFETLPVRNILLVLGMCGIVFGSVQALRADNINRMTAYSSAAQIGYIFMGIGLGGVAGYTAAVFHIGAHAVTKAQLFLTTPHLAEVSGDSLRFRDLQGSAMRDMNAGVYFLVGGLSMIGIPIFAGFTSKLQFAMAAVQCGSQRKLVLVMLVLAVSSLLNAYYFIRTLIRIFSLPRGMSSDAERPPRLQILGRWAYNVPMLILAAINIFMGLFSSVVVDWIRRGLAMFGV